MKAEHFRFKKMVQRSKKKYFRETLEEIRTMLKLSLSKNFIDQFQVERTVR